MKTRPFRSSSTMSTTAGAGMLVAGPGSISTSGPSSTTRVRARRSSVPSPSAQSSPEASRTSLRSTSRRLGRVAGSLGALWGGRVAKVSTRRECLVPTRRLAWRTTVRADGCRQRVCTRAESLTEVRRVQCLTKRCRPINRARASLGNRRSRDRSVHRPRQLELATSDGRCTVFARRIHEGHPIRGVRRRQWHHERL